MTGCQQWWSLPKILGGADLHKHNSVSKNTPVYLRRSLSVTMPNIIYATATTARRHRSPAHPPLHHDSRECLPALPWWWPGCLDTRGAFARVAQLGPVLVGCSRSCLRSWYALEPGSPRPKPTPQPGSRETPQGFVSPELGPARATHWGDFWAAAGGSRGLVREGEMISRPFLRAGMAIPQRNLAPISAAGRPPAYPSSSRSPPTSLLRDRQ
jgi:hypothetical protein